MIALSLVVIGAASAAAIALAARGTTDRKVSVSPAAAPANGPAKTSANGSSSSNPHPIAGNFKPDGTKLSQCHEQHCYEQAFGNLSYYKGPKAALELFDATIAKPGPIQAGCHRIAHFIGSAALARYHGNVPEAFAQGSATCSSGYYHGILERSFWGVTSLAKVASIARNVCSAASIRKNVYLTYQCIHGLGHGLMIYTGLNLPLALSLCHKLASSWDQKSCTGGVFMENQSSSYGFRSRWLRKNDLVYPCDSVQNRDKYYCYIMVTSRILQANGYNWKDAARICRNVERGWVDTCFQSYGRDASGFNVQNVPKALDLCRRAGSGYSGCLFGAARDMANDYQRGGVTRARALCLGAPAALRARCFAGIGSILAGLKSTAPEKRAECRAVTRLYYRDCVRGEGLTA